MGEEMYRINTDMNKYAEDGIMPVLIIEGVFYYATGIGGYSFRSDGKEVMSIDYLVMPGTDIHVRGFGKKLRFKQDFWNDKPTKRRFVYEDVDEEVNNKEVNDSESAVGYYELIKKDVYDIRVGNISVIVYTTDYGWNVYRNNDKVAEIIRLKEEEIERFEEGYKEMEKRFIVNIYREPEDDIYPFILALPYAVF